SERRHTIRPGGGGPGQPGGQAAGGVLAGCGQDPRPHLLVVLDRLGGVDERTHHLVVEQVAPIRTGQRQPGDAVRDRRLDGRTACRPPAHAPSTCARSSRRSTLPIGFFGSSGRNRITSGFLKLARRCRQKSPSSSAVVCAPWRRTTKAPTRWPHSTSGNPTTATSPPAGWPRSPVSTSAGAMFSPPRMIMSSLRPAT